MTIKRFFIGLGILFFLVLGMIAFALIYASYSSRGGITGGAVGIVNVEGVITDSKDIVEQLHKYRDNDNVKAIVMRINSPGGAVAPAQEIFEEINKVREKKKVVASMSSVAASGGYYIACATDEIVANPGTITGSIGVIMHLTDISGLMQKIGLKSNTIKSGEFKDVGNIFRSMKEEERKYLQGLLDDVHEQFIEAVAKGRHKKREDVIPLADGRVFSGRQAHKMGLVDKLGNLQDAIDDAAKMGGIEGKPNILQEKKKRFTIFDLLFELTEVGQKAKTQLNQPLSLEYIMR